MDVKVGDEAHWKLYHEKRGSGEARKRGSEEARKRGSQEVGNEQDN